MNVKLMSFNVLNAWMPNTPVYRTMVERSRGAASMALDVLPDVMCLQEFDYYYRHDGEFIGLVSGEYSEANTHDEIDGDPWNCIFYRKDKFKLIASGGYNFSANGFEVISTGNAEEASYPSRACNGSKYRYPADSAEGREGLERSRFRSLAFAVLENENGKRVIVATTHYSLRRWCHREEVEFVCEKLGELKQTYECPVIICGDLNSTTEWGAASLMLKRGYLDAFDLTDDKDDSHSCHSTSGKGEGDADRAPGGTYKKDAIDHVFFDTPTDVSFYRIMKDEKLLSVSDHCPTLVEFRI